ncbi:18606_t:CDS:2 [Acaulospora morrowiae]|uniref:18606_t:CDS:1 n=1 Tax=Acaulospora morrowiae TaxID=94023 RepID=A0A9N9AB99_9GLOM|nr:18606_t:CDS:2 [Acaulospora morrowiae]
MPTYSTITILHMTLQIISSLLLIILLYSVITSKHHFTKWTLFQLCIAAFVNNTSRLLYTLIHGNNDYFDKSPTQLTIRMVGSFMFFPLMVLPSVLAFYLWYALVKGDMTIEKRCIYYVSAVTWMYAAMHILVSLVGILGRKIVSEEVKNYAYLIPIMVVTLFALAISCHSCLILWRRWRNHNFRQNRTTAIKLGYATRLFAFSFVYIVILLSKSVSLILNLNFFVHYEKSLGALAFISDFVSASGGVLLFSVFGSSKRAAIFLPCCYYAPPSSPVPLPLFNGEHIATVNDKITIARVVNYVPTLQTIDKCDLRRFKSIKDRKTAEGEHENTSVEPKSSTMVGDFKRKADKGHKIVKSDSRNSLIVTISSSTTEHSESEITNVDNADGTLRCPEPVKKMCDIRNIMIVGDENIDISTDDDYSFINFYLY